MNITDGGLREMASLFWAKTSDIRIKADMETVEGRAKCRKDLSDLAFTTFQQIRDAAKKEMKEKAAKVADEMDTTVTLDCPCGLSTSVPCSRRHIATAIRQME